TTSEAFAIGPSRTNPLTGEILDANILFDASMVRYWRQENHMLLSGAPGAAGEPASLMQATRQGWGLADARFLPHAGEPAKGKEPTRTNLPADPRWRLWAARQGVCQCGTHMKYELGLAAMALAAQNETQPGDKPATNVPDELIGQAIKAVVMHEVGHTLGLRHNFKGSTMLKNDQLNDTNITHQKGLVGSVMDYCPVNLAPKGVKQGDYFTTTLGPYDYWAIEYAYKPLSGGTEGELPELEKIAARSAEPGHDYATDEDLYGSADPQVNVFDLGADPLKFAQDRLVLAQDLLKGLPERVVDKGEGYQRARQAFTLLLGQYGNAAYLTSNYVGGVSMYRDHRDDPHGRDPFIPVPASRQREALKFLQETIFNDRTYQFPPQLLRRLAADRWSHWGHDEAIAGEVEYPLHERILSIQRVALVHLLSPDVLGRLQNSSLEADKDDSPLTPAEVFRALTEGIWGELSAASRSGLGANRNLQMTVVRRNLQREHLKELSNLVLGKRSADAGSLWLTEPETAPADARSLARMHLREIGKRIDATLADKQVMLDDTTRAHLEECQEWIARVLTASMQIREP
ncbi:MAG: zinc-dependent metalloprotease, partial [Planctomycetes bacterium]|nr:zinc-dependent metalloprotease [Planctomycetota bacterium]